jgi:hypothetical protein
VDRQETLRGCGTLEADHLPLTLLDRQMRVLRAIVLAEPAGAVTVAETQLIQPGLVRYVTALNPPRSARNLGPKAAEEFRQDLMPHHTFTRQALYDRVWTEPMRTIAAELGVSDVGLAKACRTAGVPTPPRGWWARKQFGKPLPPRGAVNLTDE